MIRIKLIDGTVLTAEQNTHDLSWDVTWAEGPDGLINELEELDNVIAEIKRLLIGCRTEDEAQDQLLSNDYAAERA